MSPSYSDEIEVERAGKDPVTMRILRADGYCWGEMLDGDRWRTVDPVEDYYDYDDEDAAKNMVDDIAEGSATVAP